MTPRTKGFLVILTVLVIVGTGLGLTRDIDKGWEAYEKGDYNSALAHFLPLAVMGDSDAQALLGYMYTYTQYDDKDFPRNPEKAIYWYTKAAEQGNWNSALELGYWYTDGEDLDRDYVEAVKWFRIVADLKVPEGSMWLGDIYKDGLGDVPRDYLKAKFWYEEAATYRDSDPAQLELGRLYETVFENYYQAYKWYWLYGMDEAEERLKVLSEKLSPEQIELIIDDANRWQSGNSYDVPLEYQALWNEWRLKEGLRELIKVGSPIYKMLEKRGRTGGCGTFVVERDAQIRAAINVGKSVEYVAELVRRPVPR